MIHYTSKECPHCGTESEYEVEINEGSYPPFECHECGKAIDLDTDDDQADALGHLADRAHDRAKEAAS